MAIPTNAMGVFQGDVVIRTAILQALRDMRKNPWVLDFVFASLAHDELTAQARDPQTGAQEYGQKEIDKAKQWFLKTDIPVISAHRVGQPKFPCISIALLDSSEDKNTLGDVHYEVSEGTSDPWPSLVGPFTPESYSVATGELAIPLAAVGDVELSTNMVVVDANGTSHAITDVTDTNVVVLAPGTVANFRNATVRGSRPSYRVELESATFKESYVIGCHTGGDAYELLYLHSLVVFAILRYRQSLLEARGFDCSSFTSSDLQQNTHFENELVFSRYITINGIVRQYWPKLQQPVIQAIAYVPSVSVGEEAVDVVAILG